MHMHEENDDRLRRRCGESLLAALMALWWKIVAAFGIFVNVGLTYLFNLNMLLLAFALAMICLGGVVFRCRMSSNEYTPTVFCESVRRDDSERQRVIDMLAARLPTCPICWYCWMNGAVYAQFYDSLALVKSQNGKSHDGRRKMGTGLWNHDNVLWSLDHMFSYDSFRESISGGSLAEKFSAAVLFFLTWLIGSGVLVGAVIETTLRLASGSWRRWPWLFHGHLVILGWNDNVPTIIREHIESRRIRMPFGRRWAMPERIVVVTDQDPREVRRRIRASVRGHWLVTATLHCGTYDDESEIERLHISAANAIVVLGETNDPSHDAHVLLVPSRVEGAILRRRMQKLRTAFVRFLLAREFLKTRELPMELHLDSYGLYCQLERSREVAAQHKVYCRGICVIYRNFHDSWAKRLLANAYLLNRTGRMGSFCGKRTDSVRLWRNDDSNTVHLIIVGFSEMGQALATQAARVAHYGKDRHGEDLHTYITVFDAEMEVHEREYRAIFPRIDEIPDIHWTFVKGVDVGSDLFVGIINGCVQAGTDLTVAVACDNSAAGLKLATPLRNVLKQDDHTLLLVRQDIHDRVTLKDEEAPKLDCGAGRFQVFGMRDGAGYNAWYRDFLGRNIFEHHEKADDMQGLVSMPDGVREWRDLSFAQRSQISALFDATEEMERIADDNLGQALYNRQLAQLCLENDGSRRLADYADLVPYDEVAQGVIAKNVATWNRVKRIVRESC